MNSQSDNWKHTFSFSSLLIKWTEPKIEKERRASLTAHFTHSFGMLYQLVYFAWNLIVSDDDSLRIWMLRSIFIDLILNNEQLGTHYICGRTTSEMCIGLHSERTFSDFISKIMDYVLKFRCSKFRLFSSIIWCPRLMTNADVCQSCLTMCKSKY